MNQDDKRGLENQLMVSGLQDVNADTIPVIAHLINHWPWDKHEFIRDLLNECEPESRWQALEALKPHLKFKARTLESYEAAIAEKAGQMVSQRRMRVTGDAPKPIEVGDKKYIPTTAENATAAIATLICHKCAKVERFIGVTPVAAMTAARAAGWVRDPKERKEMCISCENAESADA